MVTDSEILSALRDAFASVERSEHFTDYQHCDECFEHDQTLLSRDLDTLAREDMPSAAWDPITMATPQAFAYYLPALARLTLEMPHEHWGWYGEQLLNHLNWDGPRNQRLLYCTQDQRQAVVALLEHVLTARADLVETYECRDEITQAIATWSADDSNLSPPTGAHSPSTA
jgi:hypothetical protein